MLTEIFIIKGNCVDCWTTIKTARAASDLYFGHITNEILVVQS